MLNRRRCLAWCLLIAQMIAFMRTSLAVEKSWNGADGNWSAAGSWSPLGVPGVADSVFFGNLAVAENAEVTLDVSTAVQSLAITEAAWLWVDGTAMTVVGTTSISGQNVIPGPIGTRFSRLLVRNGPAANDFVTNNLVLSDYGSFYLFSSQIGINNLLDINAHSQFYGAGVVHLTDSGTTLINDGLIYANGTPGMAIHQLAGGLYDLDGTTGSGEILVGPGSPVLQFNGTALTDAFSGTIHMAASTRLEMNLSSGWQTDALSQINVGSFGQEATPTRITGATFELGGGLDVLEGGAHLRIEADTMIAATANVVVGAQGRTQFIGTTTIDGGTFTVEQDADLEFIGETEVHGGSFSTHSDSSAFGSVAFAGATSWGGNIAVDGIARQVGNATINAATVISATVLDMDGNGNTTWDVVQGLVVNAGSLDSSVSNTFDGTLNVGGGFLGKLTVNLTGDFDEWTMAGEMSLVGDNALFITRVAVRQWW